MNINVFKSKLNFFVCKLSIDKSGAPGGGATGCGTTGCCGIPGCTGCCGIPTG